MIDFKTYLIEAETETKKEIPSLFNANEVKSKAKSKLEDMVRVGEDANKYLTQIELIDAFQSVKDVLKNSLKSYKDNPKHSNYEKDDNSRLADSIVEEVGSILKLIFPESSSHMFLKFINQYVIDPIRKQGGYEVSKKIDWNNSGLNSNDSFGKLQNFVYFLDLKKDKSLSDEAVKRIKKWMNTYRTGDSVKTKVRKRKADKEALITSLDIKSKEGDDPVDLPEDKEETK